MMEMNAAQISCATSSPWQTRSTSTDLKRIRINVARARMKYMYVLATPPPTSRPEAEESRRVLLYMLPTRAPR
jgi:hypothetical protein